MIAWGEPIEREAASELLRASLIDLAWGFIGLAYFSLLFLLVAYAGWLVALGGFVFSIGLALTVPHLLDRYATRKRLASEDTSRAPGIAAPVVEDRHL